MDSIRGLQVPQRVTSCTQDDQSTCHPLVSKEWTPIYIYIIQQMNGGKAKHGKLKTI